MWPYHLSFRFLRDFIRTKLLRAESSRTGLSKVEFNRAELFRGLLSGHSFPGSRLIQELVVQNRALQCTIVLVRYISLEGQVVQGPVVQGLTGH